MKRSCGILLPVFSLPGNYGIGCFSSRAYEWIDTLKKAGQSYWQILPLGPTGYGDSPYQSFSSFAGNPYFLDPDALAEEGLLSKEDLDCMDWGDDPQYVDYGKLWENRETVLRKAYAAEMGKVDHSSVEEKRNALNPETKEYCLYQAVKKDQGWKAWQEWKDDIRLREPDTLKKAGEVLAEDIAFREWIQVKFTEQWKKLKAYANQSGIRIIGDMPIYVASDSSDAWSHPELLWFDRDAKPVRVAGCPPDYFSPDGQLWGNPVYNWKAHEETDFSWWMNRMEYGFSLYDVIRVDHFRGFDEYYAVPAKDTTAKNGTWEKGPGMVFMNRMKEYFKGKYPELPIIAEDLGLMTDSVIRLVRDSGFPPMKVLEFAYDSDSYNLYLPHQYERNCVAYTGTHDNDPLVSWIQGLNPDVRLHMIKYQGSGYTPEKELYRDCIRTVLESVADTVVIPAWDYLGHGKEARINVPSVTGNNWKWRMRDGEFNADLIRYCDTLAELYARK